MLFGLTIEKIVVLAVVAAMIVGPERLPRYAEMLAQFAGRARAFLASTKARARDELGDDFDGVDWRSLDPRQYDPRRIVRQALLDEPNAGATSDVEAAQAAGAATFAAQLDEITSSPSNPVQRDHSA